MPNVMLTNGLTQINYFILMFENLLRQFATQGTML